MRLTQLKIAGFKSFVDPTTIQLHGQRVGIVGPNGCGKSNVMEAVRWVLGESSAKEMRADAMDAVIFNGSANRKPISRASVELTFDNSMGGASGEWSQYAEISVKRVIEREKGSSYFINNSAVRRRDVTDLFLGTGVGSRAYAIIGQNTVSRIVEAKPEEVRVFLEEAAGISKYKERRRETELRLRDTNENLTRVEDICRELNKQINKLESQAVVAQQYQQLQTALKLAEGKLWYFKKRQANHAWEKAKQATTHLSHQLEAQIAQLRKIEAEAEIARQQFYQANEATNQAQASYYAANAEVSNLESQVQQNSEARERMTQQLSQAQHQLGRNHDEAQALAQESTQLAAALAQAEQAETQAAAQLAEARQNLTVLQSTFSTANQAAQAAAMRRNELSQQLLIETNQLNNALQNKNDLESRAKRTEQQLAQLALPETHLEQQLESEIAQASEKLQTLEAELKAAQAQEEAKNTEIRQANSARSQHQQSLHQAQAELNALSKMQQSVNASNKIAEWLSKVGLSQQKRVWQLIQVNAQYQLALEAVLGERLNAIMAQNTSISRPENRAALVHETHFTDVETVKSRAELMSLRAQVASDHLAVSNALNEWLAGVYFTENGQPNAAQLSALHAGEVIVNPQGDIYSRVGVTFYGQENQLHGVLEREERLKTLKNQLPKLETEASNQLNVLQMAENALREIKANINQMAQSVKQANDALNQLKNKLSLQQQQAKLMTERQASLQLELKESLDKNTLIAQKISQTEANKHRLQAELAAFDQSLQATIAQKNEAETALNLARNLTAESDKKLQEHTFNKKININNINNLNNKTEVNSNEKASLIVRIADLENTLNSVAMESLKANLTQALTHKQAAETALAQARNDVSAVEQTLQEKERNRLQTDQSLSGIRDQLETCRLQEQEARLHFEQQVQGFAENGTEETVILQAWDEIATLSSLTQKTSQISREINGLGAVNLAAVDELRTESERKQYLDSQLADLTQASETLLEAIRKIDRETRDKLMQTYHVVNQNFEELFKVLFNGGNAKLDLVGDEILETGVHIFAQPPGKKNTSIQLLSGGEKALTAMALIFALFRLNPAPFCLMDEVDAPLDDSNTERFCALVKKMSEHTHFLFVSHNKITMEMAQQLIGVTMQESGVSRVVDVDIEAAEKMQSSELTFS